MTDATPIRTKPWPTYEDGAPDIDGSLSPYVEAVLQSGRLFRYDSRSYEETETGQFESELSAYFGCNYALALSSGTAALSVSIMALGFEPGFKVACPAFGFPATASAVLLAGGVPVIIGVDHNLHFDLNNLIAIDDGEISAVIVVHMRGFSSPIEPIITYCDERGIPIIEDAVPALGVRHNGKLLGTFGDVGCFSMQSDKTINTGEGGFLITNRRDIYEKSVLLSGAFEGRCLKHFSAIESGVKEIDVPLFNFRIDEIRSAIARHQLSGIESKVQRMQSNYRYLTDRLEPITTIRLREPSSSDGILGDALVFFLDDISPELFACALKTEGIKARSFTDSATLNARAFWNWHFAAQGWNNRLEPNLGPEGLVPSKIAISKAVDIPLAWSLNKSDLDDAIKAIEKVSTALKINGQ